eukprot:CAMPEP_0118983130 /NCGR_PEP_ID=MMETSP1173-20130426/34603_1 /TAXON_ID=1034831 /ORGANISM="Rhizochromulina marina cf, Strain CCMP1243" /LENGTH=50 /DNA_ID=CAMNT_0006933677 /DNA_START=56 /DNA_END=205 /DNA_ORIENTATION=-
MGSPSGGTDLPPTAGDPDDPDQHMAEEALSAMSLALGGPAAAAAAAAAAA